MSESRLEMGLRAIAWTAVMATVLALLAMGAFLVRPASAGQPLQTSGAEMSPLEEIE